MNAADWVGIITAAGAVILGVWKGVPAVISAVAKAISDRDKEMQKVKDEAANAIDVERRAAHERAIQDLTAATEQLKLSRAQHESAQRSEHYCKVTLARVLSWVVHLEKALADNGIPFVPYKEHGRADSDEFATPMPGDVPEVKPDPKPKRKG